MLVVKVEIWPGAEADRAYEISRVGIANVSGLSEVSDYEMTALVDRGPNEYAIRQEINKHERAHGWAPLVRRAMTGIHLADPGVDVVPYDDPIVELLRKGGRVQRVE